MMKFEETHALLVDGKSFEECHHRVHRFFDRNQLVKYDVVHVEKEYSLSAHDPEFFVSIDQGVAENRRRVSDMLNELKTGGYDNIADLTDMPQGYESKMLHTLTHLLDGFFGIDSFFYNLTEDSHWLTSRMKAQIEADKDNYWLIRVHTSADSSVSQLPKLRSLANKSE